MAPPPRKKFRYKPGTAALRDIRNYQYQKSTERIIRAVLFRRLVKEIRDGNFSGTKSDEGFVWQSTAMAALQKAAEAFWVHVHDHTDLKAIHAKRVTNKIKDMQLARRIRGERPLGRGLCRSRIQPTVEPR